ncbi:MAG: hypothetical protein ABII64_08430 [Elusimicrobiota bacterium]
MKNKQNYLVLLAYSLLSIIMTYPLVFKIFTHIPGAGFDSPFFIWNMWWTKKALLDLHANPFYSNYVFYPNGIELLTANFMIFNNLISIPFQYIFNLVFISNIFVIISYVFSGFGMYLLVRYLTGNKYAAFIAGIVFAFNPWRFARMEQGYYDLLHTEWMPFYIYYLTKTIDEGKYYKNAVFSGIFYALTTTCHYYYMVYLALFTVLYIPLQALINRNKVSPNLIIVVKKLLVTGITFVIILSPMLFSIFQDIRNNAYQTTENNVFTSSGVDIIDYFKTNTSQSFYGNGRHTDNIDLLERSVSPGYIVLLLTLFIIFKAIRSNNDVKVWFILTCMFVLFSFGSILHIPFLKFKMHLFSYYIFEYIPILNAVRIPTRFGVMTGVCFAVMAGYSLSYLLNMINKPKLNRVFMTSVAVLILFEYISIPIPLTAMTVPGIYREIAKDKSDSTLLEVPLGWMNSTSEIGTPFSKPFYYQTIHEKRLLSGGGARSRADKVFYYAGMPIINTIRRLQELRGFRVQYYNNALTNDKMVAQSIFELYNIKYILVHEPYATKEMLEYLNYVGHYSRIFKQDDIYVYEIEHGKEYKNIKDNDRIFDRLWFGYGWCPEYDNAQTDQMNARSSTNNEPYIYYYTTRPRSCRLILNMAPRVYSDQIKLKIIVNSKYLLSPDISLNEQFSSYAVPLDGAMLKRGINMITFNISGSKDKSALSGTAEKLLFVKSMQIE